MAVIDADAHVIETEQTWQYMDESLARHRPKLLRNDEPNASIHEREFWLIKGKVFPRRAPGTGGESTAEEAREARDIDKRLAHMDALGVQTQVLYPTLFIFPLTDDPEVELALTSSYNRWLAGISSQAPQRLRWTALLPYLSPDRALAEMNWAAGQGACGVFLRAMEGGRPLLDRYFDPFYREASRLNLPVCIHSGNGSTALGNVYMPNTAAYPVQPFALGKLSVVDTVHYLVMNGVPARFPDLRWGIIETGASWIPYLWHDIRARMERRHGKKLSETFSMLQDNRIYVTCQSDDDLAYILKFAGEDNLVIGSDYGHSDTSSELEFLRSLSGNRELSERVVDKILDANARALYGL